jgi:hypothetical protein
MQNNVELLRHFLALFRNWRIGSNTVCRSLLLPRFGVPKAVTERRGGGAYLFFGC